MELWPCVAAGLNAAGEVDFVLGCEQRFLGHLAKIKADGIVGGDSIDVANVGVVISRSPVIPFPVEQGVVALAVLTQLYAKFVQFTVEGIKGGRVYMFVK